MLSLDQYFQALAPTEYADADIKAAVEALYPLAQEQITVAVWGKYTNKAVVLYSMHYWAINVAANQSSDLQGPLTSASSGEFSKKTWASATGGRPMLEDYEATKWGRQYLNVRKSASGSHLFVGAGRR